MNFQWARETGEWALYADSGELLGRAVPCPGECWEVLMQPVAGGGHGWATHFEVARDWMMEQARRPPR